MELPPTFDADTYRARNPWLGGLPDDAARTHYETEGRAAGLVAAALAEREGLLALLADAGSVLEIGPFCAPLLRGERVEYLDVLDADGLRARASGLGIDPAGCPARIHHVGDLGAVDRRYDAVVSSHSVEHQPDLIRHLREVERVLSPDGAYLLIVPDKRFCLDHFLPESSVAEAIAAHREGRRNHGLASVIEHGALVTHNDPARHWAGDHGDPAQDRAVRVRLALEYYDRAGGGYVDVHAWQFTPASFRGLVDTLAALELIGLEVAEVYDTPHGRNEFCAVLRPGAAARRRARTRAAGLDLVVLQTADPIVYAPMLALTQRTVAEWARRHGHRYEAWVGVKRGPWAWQASYNRIPMLLDLMRAGHRDWALYLDADAHVVNLDFDAAAYLSDKGDHAAILATSGVTGERWDVNDGVAFVNLGHPEGRRLVELWHAKWMGLSDALLAESEAWLGKGNDQDLLHDVLREDAAVAAATLIEGKEVINWPEARFVRQHTRLPTESFAERMAALTSKVDMALRATGLPTTGTGGGDRWSARLAHPIGLSPPLIAAPVPPVRGDLARRAIDTWQNAAPAADPGPVWAPLIAGYQRDFASAMDSGDLAAVGIELAGLGRARVSQGFFGGERQHARARHPLFAERLAVWTYDKLVSLAEAVGAVPLELGEHGRWSLNTQTAPAELFEGVERALAADLSPPVQIGGHLGIAVRDGMVVHMRMLDAIHHAWALRDLASHHGDRICEIGPGAGFTAHYTARLGLTDYRLVDLPVMRAVQAYTTGHLPGVRSVAPESFGDIEPGSIDILFNSDSLPEIEREAAIGYLRTARAVDVKALLSINQEAELPGQASVAELMAEAGGWSRVRRHRHWLRQGYVEELWRPA